MEALPPAMQLASDKLEEWMKLRETIGSCYAARQLGLREEYLYKLAKQRGIKIPRLSAKVANKAAGRGLTETEKARRVGIVQEFKARRAQNIPTTKACEGLGVDLGKLCNWTRYLPIKINDPVPAREFDLSIDFTGKPPTFVQCPGCKFWLEVASLANRTKAETGSFKDPSPLVRASQRPSYLMPDRRPVCPDCRASLNITIKIEAL